MRNQFQSHGLIHFQLSLEPKGTADCNSLFNPASNLLNPTQVIMKTKQTLTCLLMLLGVSFFANGAAYIKFDGIDGESKDKNHQGWIDLSSVSTRVGNNEDWIDLHSFSQITPRDAASGRPTGKRDAASGLSTGKRDAASGLSTGKREGTSGLSTGKRDAASGLASGKRQHKPLRVTKHLDKATPLLATALDTGKSIGDVTIQRTSNGKIETITLINARVGSIQTEGKSEHVTFNYEKIARGEATGSQVRGWDPKKKEAIKGRAGTR